MTEKFLEVIQIDKGNGFSCGIVDARDDEPHLHSHDFYEFLLITNGVACHIINSKKQILSEGNLLFIRDFDVHSFEYDKDTGFKYIHISMSKKLFTSILEYMGDDFPINKLLESDDPPMLALSAGKRESVVSIISMLDHINDRPSSRLKIKTLLAELFVNFLTDYETKKPNIPSWLEETCEKMKTPANFIAGNKKMLEISGKSREHLTRTMKKYLDMSPNEYVTNLRLDYCIHLLTQTSLPIIDICYSCGFENLSWFYKVFEKKYGTTPLKYRKKYMKAKHPLKQ